MVFSNIENCLCFFFCIVCKCIIGIFMRNVFFFVSMFCFCGMCEKLICIRLIVLECLIVLVVVFFIDECVGEKIE